MLSDEHLKKLIDELFKTAKFNVGTAPERQSARECLTKLAIAPPDATQPLGPVSDPDGTDPGMI